VLLLVRVAADELLEVVELDVLGAVVVLVLLGVDVLEAVLELGAVVTEAVVLGAVVGGGVGFGVGRGVGFGGTWRWSWCLLCRLRRCLVPRPLRTPDLYRSSAIRSVGSPVSGSMMIVPGALDEAAAAADVPLARPPAAAAAPAEPPPEPEARFCRSPRRPACQAATARPALPRPAAAAARPRRTEGPDGTEELRRCSVVLLRRGAFSGVFACRAPSAPVPAPTPA